jgi:hypothetical protein
MRQRAHWALDDDGLCVSGSSAGTAALLGPGHTQLFKVAFIAWAIIAIRSRNLPAHRAAILRAYAIGQGASTQTALVLFAMILMQIEPLGFPRDLLMVGAWLVNLVIAELLIWRGDKATCADLTWILTRNSQRAHFGMKEPPDAKAPLSRAGPPSRHLRL